MIDSLIDNKMPNNITTFLFSREGNKNRYAKKILNLFCKHKIYIEVFTGTGAVFFNKINDTKINILNDNSNFIFELLTKMSSLEGFEEIIKNIENKILYFDILKMDDSVESMILAIAASFRAGGATGSLCLDTIDYKKITIDNFLKVKNIIIEKLTKNTKIVNKDYNVFLKSLQEDIKNKNTLIYCDPPYSKNKGRLKDNKNWQGLSDLQNLIEKLKSLNVSFAISEMAGVEVNNLFKKNGLKINFINNNTGGLAKKNGKNSIEILATNYEPVYSNDMFNDYFFKGE